jgi:hypothetical protein
MGQINRLIEGDAPVWHAEGEVAQPAASPTRRLRAGVFAPPLPQDFFRRNPA